MNHFLFSHFLDGGGDEENGVDASYNENDDDDMNIYDGKAKSIFQWNAIC